MYIFLASLPLRLVRLVKSFFFCVTAIWGWGYWLRATIVMAHSRLTPLYHHHRTEGFLQSNCKLLRKARSLSGGATGHWGEHQSTQSNFRSFAGHRTTPTTTAKPPANHTPPAVLLVGLRRCQWNSPLAVRIRHAAPSVLLVGPPRQCRW